ncbi:hypothetical protein MN608_10519 [Microdochium nivale]|nr:hypothetical protein MN608_10519 [Microdochium nivale]
MASPSTLSIGIAALPASQPPLVAPAEPLLDRVVDESYRYPTACMTMDGARPGRALGRVMLKCSSIPTPSAPWFLQGQARCAAVSKAVRWLHLSSALSLPTPQHGRGQL